MVERLGQKIYQEKCSYAKEVRTLETETDYTDI